MSSIEVQTINGRMLLTAQQCADLLGVHVRTFTRMVELGDMPQRVRLGKGSTLARWRAADMIKAVDPTAPV